MAQFTHLRDFYSFPGFLPATHIHGLFGDRYAAVIPLHRREKKPPVECVALSTARSTIRPYDGSATSTAVDAGSTSRCPSGGSTAGSVGL